MDPFLGEIRLFACAFAPNGWLLCAGQTLAISSNTALYSLLGTQFGGDGRSTFGLPNLQGRIAIGAGNGPGLTPYVPGQVAGSATVTLNQAQMAPHTHTLPAATTGVTGTAPSATSYLAGTPGVGREHGPAIYATPATQSGSAVTMAPGMVGVGGSGQPHNNMSPYLVLQYCIATTGVFPMRP